ncbi:MAG: Smr/MutS family protein [Gammaproteobacteria bacterium]|jgi:DNA-nicking Smr family endonuclease
MAGRDRRPSREEADLWRHVTGDVKPLARREKPRAPEVPPVPQSKTQKPAAATDLRKRPEPQAETHRIPPPPRVPELSHGAAPGVDRRTADNLRRGRMAIEARLDLHGMTQAQAHRRVHAFIEAQQASGRRCVLIVTGKGIWRGNEGGGGIGVLREAVPRWLNEPDLRPRILSFTHAQRKDGGEGALYVLLRRIR